MILTELFDTDVKYEVTRETSGQFKTEAMINGRKIVFRAELDRNEDGEFWDVSFEEQHGFHATYAATGKGKAFEVMAMVKASLAEFRDRYHPDRVFFTADSGGSSARANIYRRMVSQVLHDYELEEHASSSEHIFWYHRT